MANQTVTLEDVRKEVETGVSNALKAVKGDDEEAAAKLDKKIEEGVDNALKKIDVVKMFNIGKPAERELKLFDKTSGKLISVRKVDEQEAEFNKMLTLLATRQPEAAKAISAEIDQQVANDAKLLGHKTPTPSLSDTSARGGYAVPTEVDAQISQLIYANSVMYANANKQAVIYNGKLFPVMYGLSIADIADQGTAVTESNPTFSNPTVSVARCGAWSAISNEFISQKGADLVTAFVQSYGSAMAEFLDLRLAVGNVTNSSDLVDGCVFDANTVLDTEVAIGSLDFSYLETMVNSINYKAANLKFVGNRLVKSKVGGLKDDAGNPLFPNYYQGGEFAPLGVPFLVNPLIPSSLDVSGDKRTTGTDNVLILIDFSKFLAVMDDATRIDISKDYYFTTDLTTIRGIRRYGCKVLYSNTTASGGVCRALGLTA